MIETGWVLIKRRMGRLLVLMDDAWEDCMSGECRMPISWRKSDKCKEFRKDIRSRKGRMLFTQQVECIISGILHTFFLAESLIWEDRGPSGGKNVHILPRFTPNPGPCVHLCVEHE